MDYDDLFGDGDENFPDETMTPEAGEVATPWTDKQKVSNLYNSSRARNEAAKADLNELELQKLSRQVVSRGAVMQASATAVASFAQAVRSIPDTLERKLALEPKVIEAISLELDRAMESLARDFQIMCDPANAAF